jgi:hypothetical protein
MLYWKYSANRIFFLNEYWILIPSAILANYVIIRRINSHKEKIELLKKLKEQTEREKKIRRILYLSLSLNAYTYTYFLIRGGADLINVDYINCNIEEGLRYLDDNRFRKIIHDLYYYKRKGKIIYITTTVVCHLAHRYGPMFLSLPFAIGDFGLTNLYQTVRKVAVTVLLGGVGPLYVIGGPVALACALVLATSGLRLAFTDVDSISTSPVDVDLTGSAENLKPRISGVSDVVVVNNRGKIIMSNPVQENQEYWLPDQALLNSNCKVKPAEIPDAIDLVSPGLKYEETVNMQDITGLDRIEFTDKFDLGQTKPSIPNSHKGKMVKFLDKFGDSGTIDEKDTWDISESTVLENKYLRTRNEL